MFKAHLGPERVTLSVADISSPSLFDTSLATELTSVTPITAITSSLDSNTSGNSRETPARKALPPADVSGANTDLDRFKADLQAQTAPTLSSDLGNDLASLLKDLTSGNTSAAKADVSKVQVDLQTRDASSIGGAPNGSPLDTLIGKISDSLNSVSVEESDQHFRVAWSASIEAELLPEGVMSRARQRKTKKRRFPSFRYRIPPPKESITECWRIAAC